MRADRALRPWLPGLVLLVGCLGMLGAQRQVDMSLVRPLGEALPDTLLGLRGTDRVIPPEERKISGVSQYAFRVFEGDSGAAQRSVYVGYYEGQSQGRTIHNPKNWLPRAGAAPTTASTGTRE